jgi:hypothetical protein
MRWGGKTLHGYWRYPTVGLPAVVREEPVATADRETLAPELERVTWLGLQKLEQILRIPTDCANGSLLRAQSGAAAIAINTQMRADAARMKQVRSKDIMERIIAMMKEEEAKMAEYERLERGEREGPAAAHPDIGGPSTCAEDQMPTQDAKDHA